MCRAERMFIFQRFMFSRYRRAICAAARARCGDFATICRAFVLLTPDISVFISHIINIVVIIHITPYISSVVFLCYFPAIAY